MKNFLCLSFLIASGATIRTRSQEALRLFPIIADSPSGFHLESLNLDVEGDFVGKPIGTMDLTTLGLDLIRGFTAAWNTL